MLIQPITPPPTSCVQIRISRRRVTLVMGISVWE
jgi:hypothetical protein